MSVVTVPRLRVKHGNIVGTNKSGGPYSDPLEQRATEQMNEAVMMETEANPALPPGWNRVRTGYNDVPQYLHPHQWQADNDFAYDTTITNGLSMFGNERGAHMNFHDFNNVNGSLDCNTNAYRSNANGLEFQFGGTNPKTHPYNWHRQIHPNGFTNAYNPVESSAVKIANSTDMKWSDALFAGW